jgi:hypothetical protein
MASPKNWESKHEKYSKSPYYEYVWEHRNAPAKILVMKKRRGQNKGTYTVNATYKGVAEGNGQTAASDIRNKEDARKKAVKLGRMYSNSDDLREDISKVSFGKSL